jgi:hypothetical protein
MRHLRCLTVAVILLGSLTSVTRAQENPCSTRSGVTTCTLNPGFVATYLLSRAPNTIAVGDPKVADAAIGPGNKLVLTAKKSGTTNVIAFDSTGEEILQATVEVLTLSEDTRNRIRVRYPSANDKEPGIGVVRAFVCDPDCDLSGREEPLAAGTSITTSSTLRTPTGSSSTSVTRGHHPFRYHRANEILLRAAE